MRDVLNSPCCRWAVRSALLAFTLLVAPGSALVLAQPATQGAVRKVPMPAVSGPIASDGLDSPGNFYTFFTTDIALASHGYVWSAATSGCGSPSPRSS